MNIYTLIPTIAFLINGFVSVYIFAQKRHSRINRAYVYYSINLSFWIFCEVILRQAIPVEYIAIIFRFASIAWLSIGFWFLNFVYEFIDRKRDFIYYLLGILVSVSIALSFSTDWIIRGFEIFHWGPDESIGVLFIPVILILIATPGSYGLYLIYKRASESDSTLLKKSAPLIISGSIISLVVALVSNVVIPYLFDIRDSFQFAESVSVVQSVFIFVAVYRYRLFGLGIEDLSYNIFRTMHDSIIINDTSNRIVHLNKSAENLFEVSFNKVLYKNVGTIIDDLDSLEENETQERKIQLGGKQKFISISKNVIFQSGERIGCMLSIQDITERKIAEQKLIESEATFSELFESAPDALILVDGKGEIVQANKEIEVVFGYSRFELIGQKIDLLIPKRYHEVHSKHFDDYLSKPRRRGMGVNLELFGVKKDGEEFPVDVMLSPITQFNKKFTLSTIRDVTERKRNEKKIKESEKQYRTVVNTLPHGIVETDINGTIILVNSSYALMHGFEIEEMVGTKIWDLQANERDVRYLKTFAERAKKGAISPETEFAKRKTKDGNIIDVQIDWNYKRNSDGEIVGFISIVTDITERKKAERNLRKKRLMLSQAEQLAHLGSWEWDIANNQLYWSDELYRIYGLNRREIELTFDEYKKRIHPEDKERVLDTIENSLKSKRPFFHFEKVLRPSGEVRVLSTRGIVQTNSKNEVVGMYGSCLDVTEFKKIETDLLKSQKQLRALSASLQSTREEERTHIAREIHDELGQVLTAINMDIGLMIDNIENEGNIASEQLLGNLKSIEELIERLIRSVQDIATELRPDVLDHLGLIPALEWHLHEFERRFKIECEIKKSSDTLEIGDEKKVGIFRIFQEALTNVARHARATKVNVYLSTVENNFEMRVQDNGIGISDETLEDVKSIGLIGIKERVYLLGGKVIINRLEEGGTELKLTVPIN